MVKVKRKYLSRYNFIFIVNNILGPIQVIPSQQSISHRQQTVSISIFIVFITDNVKITVFFFF